MGTVPFRDAIFLFEINVNLAARNGPSPLIYTPCRTAGCISIGVHCRFENAGWRYPSWTARAIGRPARVYSEEVAEVYPDLVVRRRVGLRESRPNSRRSSGSRTTTNT